LPVLKKVAYERVPVAFMLSAFQSRDARRAVNRFLGHTRRRWSAACGETIVSLQLEDQHGDFLRQLLLLG